MSPRLDCWPASCQGHCASDAVLTDRCRIDMLIRMRTTLVLDDGLLRQAKVRAAERKLTVSDLVNEALRESLQRPDVDAPPFTMVTFGRGGRRVQHEPEDLAEALEDDDRTGLR